MQTLRLYRMKKVGQAAEGITVYRLKAPFEKTAKNSLFPSSVLSI